MELIKKLDIDLILGTTEFEIKLKIEKLQQQLCESEIYKEIEFLKFELDNCKKSKSSME